MAKQRYALSWMLVLLAASAAEAQVPPRGGINPGQRPVFSPYLNLLRTDQDPTLNYFGLVRPQIDFRQSIQQVEQQETGLADRQQQLINGTNATALPATGHAAGFQTQARYFMNKGRSGIVTGQGGPRGGAPLSPAGGTAAAIGPRR